MSHRRVVLWVCAMGLAGCMRTGGNARLGVDQAPGWIPRAIAARAVDVHGTCAWGRHPGAAERYRVPLRVAPNPSGVILVRADARFDPVDDDNVLGELPVGTRMLGDGPVHGGHGVGYAIVVRGHTGRVCRGYVQATAVTVEAGPEAGGARRPGRGK